MLRHYWKTAYRALLRAKGYTLITVAGLAVGLACCLLILLFVRHELRYDRHHAAADRLVRVLVGEEQIFTPTAVAPVFRRTFPEVEAAARVYPLGFFRPVIVRHGERAFEEEGFYYADSTIFDVLTLPLRRGEARTALIRPNTVVLTASAAERYFGAEDPVGRSLLVGTGEEYEITGILEALPSSSHLQFEFLASYASTHWAQREIWDSANFWTYLRLRRPEDAAALRPKIDGLLAGRRRQPAPPIGNDYALTLQAVTDIHLIFEGRLRYVYAFSAIALLVLLVACANYINLATARAARRAREVGVRKTAGAYRGQLARQFYGESVVLVGVSLLLAVALAALALPAFNSVGGTALELDLLADPVLLIVLGVLGGVVSLLAGSYPALLLSSYRPAVVLKGLPGRGGGAGFRRLLVVFQFAVSMFLIAGTLVIYQQLQYMQTKDLGFDEEHLVALSMSDPALRENYQTIKQEVLRHPTVLKASAIHSLPGYQRSGYGLQVDGRSADEEPLIVGGTPVDAEVVETLGLRLLAGPGLSPPASFRPEEGRYQYLVNEALAQEMGWTVEEAVGQRIALSANRGGEIVGVYEDYHFLPLRQSIDAQALFIEPGAFNYLLVRIAPDDVPATLAFLEATWTRLAPERPLTFRFVDQALGALYRSEAQTSRLVTFFAALALFIACLGLFGLAAYAAERRTKEIGVRKSLGASMPQMVLLLTKEFTRLVVVAFVVAAPLAYLALDRWLDDFAYRIDPGLGTFLLAGLAALVVAWLTVSYQSIRAAHADPATALRYE